MPLSRLAQLLPLLLPLLILLPNLGGAPLFDVDEGAFSEATREMLAKGDYLSTWLNGNPRFDKPILIYWLQALSVSLFGAVEWAFRLPSALAAVLWCYVVSRFAEEYLDPEAGRLAGIIALTCLGVQLIGRAATADALLNLLLTLTLTDAWRHLASGRVAPLRRAFLWTGLGFLTKGPIALLLPGVTVLLWCLTSGRWQPLRRALSDPASWLLLIGVALPWYVVAYAIHGQAFIDGFLLKHNVQRFTATLEGHGGSALYYLLVIPLLVFPWLAWLASALRNLPGQWREPLPRFLWLWCGFVVVFFSLSGTKLPHYALYGCTPLFMLLAAQYRQIRSPLAALPALLLLGLYAAVPVILKLLPARADFYGAQLTRLDTVLAIAGTWPAWLALGLAAAVIAFWRRPIWQRVAVAALLGNLVVSFWLAPLLGELVQGPIKRAAAIARANGSPVVQWQTHWPSFSVYLGAETPLRAPASGEIAVTRSDRLPQDPGYQVIHREAGVALVRRLP